MAIDLVRDQALATPADILDYINEKGIKFVDLKFVDLPGSWQHYTIPVSQLEANTFEEGLGFDGSSIRGFQKIHESDMLLVPDPSTAFVDPACKYPTISLTCDIKEPITMNPYSRDPRYISRKAEAFLAKSGIATKSYWGPEAEFFIFNDIRFDQGSNFGFYHIDSDEGIWNSGKNDGAPNLGYRPRNKEGYFPVPPVDKLQNLRSEIVINLMEAGLNVETHHHEVSTAGQAEIDLKFDTLLKMADQLMVFKYIIKNTCYNAGYTATFMPKPTLAITGRACTAIRASGKTARISSTTKAAMPV